LAGAWQDAIPGWPADRNTLDIEVGAAIAGLGVIGRFKEFIAWSLAIASAAVESVLEEWCQSFSAHFG
jgi:hypothetical protein